MIRVYQYDDVLNRLTQEYICPSCEKVIKWFVLTQLSPFQCLGCLTPIEDISLLIRSREYRVEYHLSQADTSIIPPVHRISEKLII